MQISIFTDEIDRKRPERAIALASEWGVTHVEVRSLAGGRFPAVSDDELETFYRRVLDAGLAISAVSPGFFKCPVDDPSVEAGFAEGLQRACAWAKRWGTDMVSCFAFDRDDTGQVPAEVIDRVGEMVDIIRREGCRPILENEAACWGATGLEAAEIIRQFGADRIGLCWDPGNSARAGSKIPFPDEYETLKELVAHVHVKNYDPAASQWALAEQGVVDWPGQFRALREDGYSGFVVIETHLALSPNAFEVTDPNFSELDSNSYRNLEFVRECLDETKDG